MAYITKLKAVKTRSLIEIVEILKGRMCAEAVLVGSGGGNLWDISLGAEKSFVKKSEKILKEYGFEI